MACVRFKRALTDDVVGPPPMISVKRPRLCSDVQDQSSSHEKDYFKAVFKFLATVESKDENVDPLFSEAVINECREASGGRSQRKSFASQSRKAIGAKQFAKGDRRRRRRCDQQVSSSEARYRLVSTLRGSDANQSPSEHSKPSTFDDAVKGLYTIYDVEDLSVDSNETSKEPLEQITCNGVAMICEQKKHTKYVYDLYFAHDCNAEQLDSTQGPVCIEPCFDPESRDFHYNEDSDASVANGDDDSDSNDESNWRNDYPDEDDNFEKEYDYYRDYGDFDIDEGFMADLGNYASDSDNDHDDDDDDDDPSDFVRKAVARSNDAGLHRHLESMALRDSNDDEEVGSSSFQEDVMHHGRTYAEYKARMKSYLDCGNVADGPSEAKSSDTDT